MNSNSVRSCNALSARGSGKSSKHSENCFIGCSLPIRSHLQNQFLPALQLITYIPNMRFPCLWGRAREGGATTSEPAATPLPNPLPQGGREPSVLVERL